MNQKSKISARGGSASGGKNQKLGFTSTPFQKKDVSLQNRRGFTLLLASLVASLLLGVSIGIFNIVFKELLLTSSSKESQNAFYASDTGIECALYHDFKNRNFATSVPSSPSGTINCDSQNIAATWIIVGDSNSAITTFNLDGSSGLHCATVTVNKKSDGSTEIDSRGYNTCDINNLRRVERGIKVSY